jgi:hypothetical protein
MYLAVQELAQRTTIGSVRISTPMTASAVSAGMAMGRFFSQVRSAGGTGLEGNTVRQICDESRACS